MHSSSIWFHHVEPFYFDLNHLFISLDKVKLKSVAGKTSTFIADILIIPLLYKVILFAALARFSVFALYYFVEIKTFNFSVMEQCWREEIRNLLVNFVKHVTKRSYFFILSVNYIGSQVKLLLIWFYKWDLCLILIYHKNRVSQIEDIIKYLMSLNWLPSRHT